MEKGSDDFGSPLNDGDLLGVSVAQRARSKTHQDWWNFLQASVLRSLGPILVGLKVDEVEVRYNEFDGGIYTAVIRDVRIRFIDELGDGAWAVFILQENDVLPEFLEDIRTEWEKQKAILRMKFLDLFHVDIQNLAP